jgi:hypothetical protein
MVIFHGYVTNNQMVFKLFGTSPSPHFCPGSKYHWNSTGIRRDPPGLAPPFRWFRTRTVPIRGRKRCPPVVTAIDRRSNAIWALGCWDIGGYRKLPEAGSMMFKNVHWSLDMSVFYISCVLQFETIELSYFFADLWFERGPGWSWKSWLV